MSPAQKVITRFGGVSEMARLTGIRANAIYKWTYGKDKGGTGGLIPGQNIPVIVDAAKTHEIPLDLADFGSDAA